MIKKITFEKCQDITKPGLDGKERRFFFSAVDLLSVGQPEEKQHTKHYSITMGITGSLLPQWGLEENDADKITRVLFWHAKRHLENMVRTSNLKSGEKIILHTGNSPQQCPFEIDRIPSPDGFSFEIEVEKPKIGFHS